ncbi:leucine--tRNA ligase [Candidatus Symbiobacter mobilis]|uniref:Leucine--tRNA ligase n=1 Tax=Candidatus Symbiobacter mobilis CR TaxID=946483 RepID=U5NA19_9BURK|nr:leucine--tRNA ligase [Candidatus Symbiobacter mobilis]AGX87034.1 leucyl-tRNA synthetase [Candidatus Symbiobacter mobilis CR]
MLDKYLPQDIERLAQEQWRVRDAYRVTEHATDEAGRPRHKYYACSMLPYPSGKLHMGHVRNYTINDMLTRHLRMKGYNVLMPMGWDAFGLPAENAALKHGVPPAQWTFSNIAAMKAQMQALGLAIDWSREIATCIPEYYRWNQWMFLRMLERGIAYRKTQVVNWDPVDKTVLANEQVIDGRGWRTGALVEKREIPGYYLKITDYAEELLSHVLHDNLPGWPDRVKKMQENWIGKSEGVRFAFPHDIRDEAGNLIQNGKLYVFTTRADTIMGVTFCAVAPEHPIAAAACQRNAELAQFVEACQRGGTTEAEMAVREKEGMPTGFVVTHPLTGQAVPVWVGNYVLMGYGDGAVMGVPAHDERDFAFANKYGLPIQQVVALAANPGEAFDPTVWKDWYAQTHGTVAVHSGSFDGLDHRHCVHAVAQKLVYMGLGEKTVTWRLRDWSISRQRYWGTPIPIIHCEEHGAVPVPDSDLPVVLPLDCIPDGTGNPLVTHEGFHAGVTCPICGKPARRETDTMDTFVDSAWYFLRYLDPHDTQAMVGEGARYWMPMDQYIGGIEHAVLHLLYARFWTKVMRDLDLIEEDEPFTRLLTQGMVLNQIYSRRTPQGGKEYFWPQDVEPILDEEGKIAGATLLRSVGGLPAGTRIDYEGIGTMSKSKNNGVDPQALIDKYGADTARLYTMFTAPPESSLEWNDGAVEGSFRFLRRVWAYAARFDVVNANADAEAVQASIAGVTRLQDVPFGDKARALRREVHQVLGQVNHDYDRMQYNTVVSGTMKMLHALEDFDPAACPGAIVAMAEGFGILLRCLYPVAPHLCYVLWQELGYAAVLGDLLDVPWPRVDATALQLDEVELVLQINGKLRGAVRVPADAGRHAIEQAALQSEAFARFAHGATPKKIVIVPGRLINVVV